MLGGATLLLLVMVGCQQPDRKRSSLFEQAETHYRRGEYGAALDDYQAFLERHRQSPLAKTARLRIRSVNREVESVMGRKDMPRPDYTGSEGSGKQMGRNIPARQQAKDAATDAGEAPSPDSSNSSPTP